MGEQQQLRFPGFPEKPKENYWQYPEVMNGFWHALTPVEQKILDYILRHTWGWHKNSDYLSYSQFKNGIPGVDSGTGIKSDKAISRALKGLERKNMVKIISGKKKGITNLVYLVLKEGLSQSKRGDAIGKEGGCAQGSIPKQDTINNAINTYNKYGVFNNLNERRIAEAKPDLAGLKKYRNIKGRFQFKSMATPQEKAKVQEETASLSRPSGQIK